MEALEIISKPRLRLQSINCAFCGLLCPVDTNEEFSVIAVVPLLFKPKQPDCITHSVTPLFS